MFIIALYTKFYKKNFQFYVYEDIRRVESHMYGYMRHYHSTPRGHIFKESPPG